MYFGVESFGGCYDGLERVFDAFRRRCRCGGSCIEYARLLVRVTCDMWSRYPVCRARSSDVVGDARDVAGRGP
jgi:hypothetical protein